MGSNTIDRRKKHMQKVLEKELKTLEAMARKVFAYGSLARSK